MSNIGLHPLGTARLRAGLAAIDRSFPEELRAGVAEHDLPEEAIWVAWEITRLSPALTPGERRATLLLVLATMIAVKAGSTRLPLPDGSGASEDSYLGEALRRLRVPDADLQASFRLARALRQQIGPSFAPMFGGPGDYKPFIVEGGHLYQQRMLHHEERVAATLRDRLRGTRFELPASDVDTALAQLRALAPMVAGAPAPLSGEQEAAVRAALTGRLTIVSGGPGTGKTSIVVSILRALVRLGVPIEEVALAAPTGKAAKRMDESIKKALAALPSRSAKDESILAGCAAPRTLHRLLGASASGDRFKHHEGNQLAESVVIVDECSMVDLFLMDQLARAVRADARLVLIGDADQLPSVDAGAVLRDLLPDASAKNDPRARAAHRLTHSYRMRASDASGEAILEAARLVNAGEGAELFEQGPGGARIETRAGASELVFDKVELLAPGTRGVERQAFFARWYEHHVRGSDELEVLARKVYHLGEGDFPDAERADLDRVFRHFEGFRLLCVTRGDGRPTGAEAVNATLHRLAAQRLQGPGSAATAAAFLPGEPVMMHRNDYDRGLFNGDQGLILRVAEAGGGGAPHTRAVFPRKNGWAVFHLDALRADLTLAYAVTVHKGQGSEFDHVGVVLPDAPLPILTRELLYTAVTRSRRSVTIVGSPEVLIAGAAAQLHRFSGIGERLAGEE